MKNDLRDIVAIGVALVVYSVAMVPGVIGLALDAATELLGWTFGGFLDRLSKRWTDRTHD